MKSLVSDHLVVFLLGSNLGNRRKNLEKGRVFLSSQIGRIVTTSGIYKTEAWGMKRGTPHFLNQVVSVSTSLEPRDILQRMERIEVKTEADTEEKYQSRELDIDILFYGNEIIHEEGLHIPHPLIQKRNFALVPLREIMPGFVHPELDRSIEELYRDSEDKGAVKLVS